jgi:type III pantothenate kinase
MLLAVDVGNSNTSLGVFADEDEPRLVCELRLSTGRNWTRDELGVLLHQALGLHEISLSSIRDAAVACVVPPVQGPLIEALRSYAEVEPLVVGPGVKTGIPVLYDPPQDVGADRIVSAIAAHERHGRAGEQKRPVIVVDFGTATTFDVVSAKPEYLGGVIAPGIGISADALFARASKLPRVDVAQPPRVVGRNTVHAMQSGLFYGSVGLVEGMIARISEELARGKHGAPAVVATGGHAGAIAAQTDRIDAVDDTLMLRGLWSIFARNRGPRTS